LQWSVVGAGSIGRRHLRNLRALGVPALTAIRRRLEPLGEDLEDVRVSTMLPAAGDDRAAAVICSPTACHAADAIAAVDAGYHVLIEKPLADTAKGAAAIREAATRRGRVVMVGSCLRFHPVLQQLRSLMASGELGETHWAATWCGQHLAEWRPARDLHDAYSARAADGGGVLLDLIHELDYMQWLWGAIRLTSARVGSGARLGIDAEETADLVMELPGGGVATCHLDYLARPATRGGRLAGEDGSARWDLLTPSLDVWTTSSASWLAQAMPAAWTPNQMYSDELTALADCVLGVADNASSAVDGERALVLALQARASGKAGRC